MGTSPGKLGHRTEEADGDGRSARRERNIDAVLDAVIDLFTAGDLFPTVEQVSKRSGLSVRSVYRYFPDPASLRDAAIRRHRARSESLAHLSAIGQGPLDHRIEEFVAMRLRLHNGIGAAYRATVYNAPRHSSLQEQLARNRSELRDQFEQQFRAELSTLPPSERRAVVTAGDILTQLDSIDVLRFHRGLSVAKTTEALRVGLQRLLGGTR
ncbi:MAG: TetR/AcrR family transcriptional regulator [Actinomycetota bacterium]